MRKSFIFIWLLSISFLADAQQNIIKELAEPFYIELTFDANENVTAKESPSGMFEVLEILQISANQQNNTKQVAIQMVAYDTGIFRLSEFINGIDPQKDIMISIGSPPENLIKEYAPVKEIDINIKEPTDYQKYFLLTAVLLAIALAVYFLKRKKKHTQKIAPENRVENWQEKIGRLSTDWKNESINSIELGEGLISVLHNRFKVSHKKSVKKLMKAIEREKPSLTGNDFKSIMSQTDAWRFGKQKAELNSGLSAIETIRRIIES